MHQKKIVYNIVLLIQMNMLPIITWNQASYLIIWYLLEMMNYKIENQERCSFNMDLHTNVKKLI